MAQNQAEPKKEVEFNEFYTEVSNTVIAQHPFYLCRVFKRTIIQVKEIEKRDSVLTPKQQIERLLRPGSTYFNLNPFEVLQVDPETPLDEVKKKYRRFSILVHPDKNQDDADRAQQAFEIINRAWKTLENEDSRKKCMDIVEEAKGRTDIMVSY